MENNKPVRPNLNNSGQRPVRPNLNSSGQRPARPNLNQRPVRPEQKLNQLQKEQSKQPKDEIQFNTESVENKENKENNNFPSFESEITFEEQQLTEDKKGKKSKKVKKEKKEKPPKKQKIPKEPKTQKESKEPSDKKSTPNKTIKIIGIILGVIIIIGILVTILKAILSSSNQHIKTIDLSTYNNSINVAEKKQDNIEEKIDDSLIKSSDIQSRESTLESPMELNEYAVIKTILNTKTATDDTFVDHEANIYIRNTKFVTGYDEVKKFVDDYNKDSNTVVNLPKKKKYYSQNAGTELAMLEFELLYTSDYPTHMSEAKIYEQPELKMSLYGTTEVIDSDEITDDTSKYILVNDMIYSIAKATNITNNQVDKENGFNTGKPLIYRFIVSIPVGANETNYEVHVNTELNNAKQDIYFKGQNVESKQK